MSHFYGSTAAAFAASLQAHDRTEVYQHEFAISGNCMVALKGQGNCPAESFAPAQLLRIHFILNKTSQINKDEAKALIDDALRLNRPVDLQAAGIIFVKEEKFDLETGRRTLSVTYGEDGDTTATWFDPETSTPTQTVISDKNGKIVNERQHPALTAQLELR